MDASLVESRPGRRIGWGAGWHHILVVIAGAVLLHQLLMVSPLNMQVMPAHDMLSPMNSAMPCEAMCPPILRQACMVAEQLLPRPIAVPLLLVALVSLLARARARSSPPASRSRWRWPAKRRRALLQIFLI